MTTKFDALPWSVIVEAMGGTITSRRAGSVRVYLFRQRSMDLLLSDNGGEINVSEIVPYGVEVKPIKPRISTGLAASPCPLPYDYAECAPPGPLTLASWILHHLDGEWPDYSLDLDKED